jgi:hypothetical protein
VSGPIPRKKSVPTQRWVLIGGGLIVVALLIALLATTASVDSFLFLGLDTLKRSSLAHLDQDVPVALREELRKAFDCAITAATSGQVGEDQVGEFARACRVALEDKVVGLEEAASLRDLALALCGRG